MTDEIGGVLFELTSILAKSLRKEIQLEGEAHSPARTILQMEIVGKALEILLLYSQTQEALRDKQD